MPKKKTSKKYLFVIIVAMLLVVGYLTITLRYSKFYLKSNQPEYVATYKNNPLNINWPAGSNASISLTGYGTVADIRGDAISPTASTAKMITAIMILKKFPLNLNQSGPIYAISSADVDIYKQYLAENGSTTKVILGEQINEEQMLESMLIASSDNIADTLAIWAYGSLSNYQVQANNYLKSLGILDTTVGSDASGLNPSTMSTPNDLNKIATILMQSSSLASIVAKRISSVPVAGTIYNYNVLLGKQGINGVKTGNTDQAGGVLSTSSSYLLNNNAINIYTSVAKTDDLSAALEQSLSLVSQARNSFSTSTDLENYIKGYTNYYLSPWNNQKIFISISGYKPIAAFNGSSLSVQVKTRDIGVNSKKGDKVGSINISTSIPKNSYSYDLVLAENVQKPSNWWLITHPL